MEDVDVGGGLLFGDVFKFGGDVTFCIARRGPTDDAVFAVGAGVRGEAARFPDDAEDVDRCVRIVPRDERFQPGSPTSAGDSSRKTGGGDAAKVPPPAVEEDHSGVIQGADQFQRLRRVLIDGVACALIQQAPNDDAGVIAVAEDHLGSRVIEPIGELRRHLHRHPGGLALVVDHQAQFVGQIELISHRHSGDEADGVETHHLGVDQIAAEQVRIVGKSQADRRVVAGVGAAEEDAFSVQAEIAVLEDELAEARFDGRLIVGIGVLFCFQRGGDAVEVWIVQLPKPRVVDCHDRTRGVLSRFECHVLLQATDRGAGSVRGDGDLQRAGEGPVLRIEKGRLYLDLACLRVCLREDVGNPRCRSEQKFDRIDNSAVVECQADAMRPGFQPSRGHVQADAVNRFFRRIQDAHDEEVFLPGLYGIRRIECKRGFAPLVAAKMLSVEPDVGPKIDGPEAE